jgi:hypothetical protein
LPLPVSFRTSAPPHLTHTIYCRVFQKAQFLK